MTARKYRASWDEIAYLDADHIARGGVFDGFCGPIGFDDCRPAFMVARHDPRSDVLGASWDGEDKPVRSLVRLERRPCRFGGARVYFICPSCARRTLRLAVLDEGLRCGTCGHITWGSRRETQIQRLVRKAHKLARRLGLEHFADAPVRPPRMRMRTYLSILGQLEPLKYEINRRAVRRLAGAAIPFSAMTTPVRWGL